MPAPSYSPPAGNAVNFNFTGPPYSAPAGNSVILNFVNVGAYTLTADPGSYAVSGAAAALKVGRHLFAYDQLIPGLSAGGFKFTSIAGWTVVNLSGTSSFTLTLPFGGGQITVDDTSGGSASATRAISVKPGQQYTLEGHLIDVTASMGMAVGTTPGGTQLGSVLSFANGVVFTSNPVTNPLKKITFIGPASGTIYVSLFTGASGQGKVSYLRMEQAGNYQLSGTDPTITKTGRLLQVTPGVYTLTGSPASIRIGRRLVAEPGVYIQTRTSVRLLIGRRLSADPGAYTLTGSPSDISYIIGRYIRAESGSYALQGSDARLLTGRKLTVTPGSYVLTGTAASWVYARRLSADPGSYTINGASVAFRIGYRLAAQPGSYLLTGTDVDLINRRLIAEPGAYAFAGAAARLLVGRRLAATPGVYLVTGAPALLLYGRRMAAAAGSYTITGVDAALKVGRRLTAAAGLYALTGGAVQLRRGYTVHAIPGSYVITWSQSRIVATRRMLAEAGVYRTAWPDVTLTPTWRPRGPRAIGVGFAASRYLAVPPENRRVSVEPQNRYIAIEPAARRYAAVEPRDMEPEGGSMLQWPEKDPNEVLDYELDWAQTGKPRLEAGETLTGSTWNIVEGDVVIDVVNTTYTPQGLSTLWLSAGTPGTRCILLNRVTTSKGRTYDKSVVLRVKNH